MEPQEKQDPPKPSRRRPLITARVLIVEDDPAVLEILTEYITCLGYTPVPVPDGETAIALATAAPPDLVISDVMLPHMSGLEVCLRLKAARETGAVPVALITAFGTELEEPSRQVGADCFLAKPFCLDELRGVVQQLLGPPRG
jgi:DNA-binding response OmpR family regulator